ncbi:DNA-directed RNA polymerase subunit delta [Salicibibacter cibarius]|uniref:Probable DNA-directed RNA polymerase subunit delta n=1 Tax=Salicibibacter cibarius TaxID=2743000 RepID=A0A7T6Z6X9_9BACI|nr:DNA-directed RNA polymerase subunit delta [Salicibibacter cibarius]QQK78009.1 DNA-directed RNA polymerase subunit delta [Salicibibacter cibarius]
MTIRELDQDEVLERSAVELAYELLKEKREPVHYKDLFAEIAEIKQIKKEQMDERRTKLFTDLNIGGSFVHLGANHWGLKAWYPVDQTEEDLSRTVQPSSKSSDDQGSEHQDNDLEDLEDELDELANEDDADKSDEEELDGFGNDDHPEDEEEKDQEGDQ